MAETEVTGIEGGTAPEWLVSHSDQQGQLYFFVIINVDGFDVQPYGPFDAVDKAQAFHASARNVLGHTLADLQALAADKMN
jgi:hypothetical protein